MARKICFLSLNLYMHGGIQRLMPVLLNELCKNEEVTVVMPYDERKDKNIYGISNKVNIVNFNLFPHYNKKNVRDIFSYLIYRVNKKTAIFDTYLGRKILKNNIFPKKQLIAIQQYINLKEFDIVVGVADYFSLLLSYISQDIKSLTLGWQHNTFDMYFNVRGKNSYGLLNIFKEKCKILDGIIVLTDKDKISFEKIIDVPIYRLYNPVSFSPIQNYGDRTKPLIFVGRLYKQQKGLDYLLKIIKLLVEKKEKIKIYIVGDGKDKLSFQESIKKERLETNIILAGGTNDVEKYYKNASVFLHTSRHEGFGIVIVEAMSYGIPVVAFHNNGPDEIIENNKQGYLVEKWDIEDFVNKVIKLLDDEETYNRFSVNSKARSKDFSSEIFVREFNEIINNIEKNTR